MFQLDLDHLARWHYEWLRMAKTIGIMRNGKVNTKRTRLLHENDLTTTTESGQIRCLFQDGRPSLTLPYLDEKSEKSESMAEIHDVSMTSWPPFYIAQSDKWNGLSHAHSAHSEKSVQRERTLRVIFNISIDYFLFNLKPTSDDDCFNFQKNNG